MKYASGEHAEVGDIIEVVNPKATYTTPLQAGAHETVARLEHDCVYLAGKDSCGFWASRFKLIKRQEKPVSALVKWPEQEQLRMDDLTRGDWFVFVDAPQIPCVAFDGSQHIQILAANGWPAWTLLTSCSGLNKRLVRRLKQIAAPQFTVI